MTTFETLVEKHQPELLAYLRRMVGDAHDAEDICQEALLRAYRAYGRLPIEANHRAWLYKIATNTAFNWLKKHKRESERTVELDLETLAADAAPEQRDDLRVVAHALRTLPPKQRAALMQRQFQGLEYAEIAQTLGCSETAARANVYQALKKLRAALTEV